MDDRQSVIAKTIPLAAAAWMSLTVVPTAWAVGPIAELPASTEYTSWIRILLIAVAILPWLAFCQWVDKDTQYVRRMNRELWNGVVLGGGIVGLILWLMLPWATTGLFAAGFGLWFFITAATCSIYVVLRNNMVDASVRVFTPRHIKSWFASFGKPKTTQMDAVERVKLTNHEGRKVTVPTDPTAMEPYEAAQTLLFDALWRRATEVELLVAGSGLRLAYRIDGVGVPRSELLTREAAEHALRFIKQVAGLNPEERRKPQEGTIKGGLAGGHGMTEIDVKTSGTTQQERLSLRIVGDENRLRIADLGMTEKQQKQFESIIAAQSGLVLIGGPKASGVTTTLYAALRGHDAFMQNLLSLEKKPLMELENITQHIYDEDKPDSSYARQLQTILRREPDVVLISDCLDRETAHLAVKAATDGKKIYMGIQAKDSFEALKKLLNLAGDTEAAAKVLLAVTSQRLVRKLCIACRVAYKPDIQLLRKANLPADKIEQFYRPPREEEMVDEKGNPKVCANCQASGYFGRAGVFEVLEIDGPMRDLIRKGEAVPALQAQARKNSMLYLQEVGLQKVIAGVTSMNEVIRVMRDEENNGSSSVPAPKSRKGA